MWKRLLALGGFWILGPLSFCLVTLTPILQFSLSSKETLQVEINYKLHFLTSSNEIEMSMGTGDDRSNENKKGQNIIYNDRSL